MPRGKKKATPDEFVDWTIHVYEFIRRNIKLVAGTLIIAVVVFAVTVGAVKLKGYRTEKAAQALYEAQSLEAGSSQQMEALAEVADKYGATGSGRLAMMMRGDVLIAKGEYESAARQFGVLAEKSKKHPLLQVAALHSMAQSLFAMGKIEEAADVYLKAAEVKGNLNRDDSLYQAALCFEQIKNFDKAHELHSKIIDTGTDEVAKSRAEERIIWLAAQGLAGGSQ